MLYAPIIIIAIFSFTDSKVLGNWTGFSVDLYTSLFSGGVSGRLIDAIKNTFLIALVAATVSTLLGTVAAIGINDLRYRKRRAINFVNNIPILNPDIITGISLFLLFVSLGVTQGYTTVILAHIAFCDAQADDRGIAIALFLSHFYFIRLVNKRSGYSFNKFYHQPSPLSIICLLL